LSETPPHDAPPPAPAQPPAYTDPPAYMEPPVQPPPPLPDDATEGWYVEPDELPPRPRARLLTPLTVVLMLVLFAAGGFIGGVLVQKGQQSGSATLAGGASSRFGAGATGASGAAGAAGGAGGFASRFASRFGGGAGSLGTVGTVTNIDGDRLYVTTAAGTITQVVMTHESKITKSQPVGANAIRPGDSVVVSGVTATNGTVTAASVTDSGVGGSAVGGAASLFGGGTGTGATSSTGGSASLFGG
jgi:hypothetical protein